MKKKAEITDIILVALVVVFAAYITTYVGFSKQLVLAFLGISFFILAFFKTDFALTLLIFAMLLSPAYSLGGAVGSRVVAFRLDDVFLFVVFFGWFARTAVNKELGFFKKTPLTQIILIYFSIAVISTLAALIRGNVVLKSSFLYLFKYFEYYLLYFMVVNNIRSYKQVRVFVYSMLIVCFIVCLYAIYMRFQGMERVSAPFEGKEGEANTLAGYLILMMSLAISSVIFSPYIKLKAALLGLISVSLTAFVFTLSRGGWLSFVPMFTGMIVFSKKNRPLLILVGLIALFAMPRFLPKEVYKRVHSTFSEGQTISIFGKKIRLDESTRARINGMQIALDKFKQRPVIGFGVPAAEIIDNQYARVLRETGLLGFLAFLGIIVIIFKTAFNSYKTVDDWLAKAVSLGVICGLMGILVQCLSAESFIIIRIMEPFWFLTAIVVSLPELEAREKLALGNQGTIVAA